MSRSWLEHPAFEAKKLAIRLCTYADESVRMTQLEWSNVREFLTRYYDLLRQLLDKTAVGYPRLSE
jgi:hypothetical protein